MHPQCHPASTSRFLPLLVSQPPPRAAHSRGSSQASGSSYHQEQAQSWLLQGDPWKYRGAAGICWTREETCSELCLCQETLDLGPGISRAKPSTHVSVWAEGPHPSGLLCQPLPRAAVVCKVCWWQGLSSSTSRAQQGLDLRPFPLGGWEEALPP